MANELTVIETDILNVDEKSELNANIDRIIEAHKNNRQEINRLVFESVAAMTEADQAQEKLSNKGFFRRFIGGITGSNQKLQNKINSNRAVVQYAAQQTLQKLAEQNLMTFDLITAVNNKLNASIYDVNTEFNRIYTGLEKFLKHSRNEIVRLETRLARVEQNVQLLTWQNSIEYLEFDGEEYLDMDDTKKIVCLTRDFFDITKGNWTTSDLLLLKTAMATIGIQPRAKVNYLGVLREIEDNEVLKNKLLNGKELQPIIDPSYLIALGTLKKMESLKNEESYIVDTVNSFMNQYDIEVSSEYICDKLVDKYLQEKALVNINIDVDSYDMILDLLYNLKQAESENLIVLLFNEQMQKIEKEQMQEAEQAYLKGDFKTAFDIFSLLADNGNGRAMYFMGLFYQFGCENLIKINKEWANIWFDKGMKLGDPLCIWAVADNLPSEKQKKFFNNINILGDIIELVRENNLYAQYTLGVMYCYGNGVVQNYEEAVKWYRKAAERGYYMAQCNLGIMYESGTGVIQDYKEAVEWYRKAAVQGYCIAQCNLGLMYEFGKGLVRDYKEAVKWYRKAAEQGYSIAQCNLGLMYNRGKGVVQDYKEAVKWYRKAAVQGDNIAQCNLAIMYESGEGVAQNDEEAIKWYRKAAEQGNSIAQCGLGLMYELGERVTKNYEEAAKWYKKAAEQGDNIAQCKLGDMYESGTGVVQDYKEAVKWYRKAAEQGNNMAQCNLGCMYEKGYGVKEDKNEAVKWYKEAVEQGNINAKIFLERLMTKTIKIEATYKI